MAMYVMSMAMKVTSTAMKVASLFDVTSVAMQYGDVSNLNV